MLFEPGLIGNLELPNRLVRSATAEKMADPSGAPLPKLHDLYSELAQGGVGLIITGHLYIDEGGKCHPEMTGIHRDELIPDLKKLTRTVHEHQGKIVAQINHGGGNCSSETVPEPVAPSNTADALYKQPARALQDQEIKELISAFAQAARRAQKAGFDGVQIHGAHGYLISQFLSPLSNQRDDRWGGNPENRSRFLRKVSRAVRQEVGPDYPVLIKLGLADGPEGGLAVDEGTQLASRLEDLGLDGLEISTGFSGERFRSIQKGIRRPDEEAYLLPLVKQARPETNLPILAVGGYRSRKVMEQVLLGGWAEFISLSRPLIREPSLPKLFREGKRGQSQCLSANNCWPESTGEGISCKCPPVPEGKG